MFDEFDRSALDNLKNLVEIEDIFENLDFFFGFSFKCCPCVFIKKNTELLSLYETIRFHIIRSIQND